jgi:hypothetical protein
MPPAPGPRPLALHRRPGSGQVHLPGRPYGRGAGPAGGTRGGPGGGQPRDGLRWDRLNQVPESSRNTASIA